MGEAHPVPGQGRALLLSVGLCVVLDELSQGSLRYAQARAAEDARSARRKFAEVHVQYRQPALRVFDADRLQYRNQLDGVWTAVGGRRAAVRRQMGGCTRY